jgi:hypothetical protein
MIPLRQRRFFRTHAPQPDRKDTASAHRVGEIINVAEEAKGHVVPQDACSAVGYTSTSQAPLNERRRWREFVQSRKAEKRRQLRIADQLATQLSLARQAWRCFSH